MQSCAWMNGQYQQHGPLSQSSQAATPLTHDTMRNRQGGTANNCYLYRTLTTGGQPQQSAHLAFRDGAYSNRQMSSWHASAVSHQTVSPQQPARVNTNNYLTGLNGNLQKSSTNMQSGNHGLVVTNGVQVARQQDFHQNSMGNWNQSIWAQDGNMSNRQYCRVQKSLSQNVNGASTLPVSAYTTTATSLPHEQVGRTNKLMSAQNRQTAHNQYYRQNSIQHGFSPSFPPTYDMAVSQSFTNSITANTASEQSSYSMLQKTQQYSSQRNNGDEATTSVNSNSFGRQYETNPFLAKTNNPSLNPAADTQQMPSRQMIVAGIADSLRNSFTASSDGRPLVYTSSPYNGKHASEVRMMESNQSMQPVSTVTESYSPNALQSLPFSSRQSLPETTHSVMSRQQHSVDTPPQQSSVPNVSCNNTARDGSGSKTANAFFPVGSLSNASQLMQLHKTQSFVANNGEMLEILERLSSVKSNDSSIHSSPGRTGARAVAVVQPLSQESYQIASEHTSSNTVDQMGECTATNESINKPEKLSSPAVTTNQMSPCLREESNLYPESPNRLRSNKSSRTSSDGTFVSSSDSAENQDLSPKQICADDTRSELAISMQVDQCVSPTTQQSLTSEVPVIQCGDEEESVNPADEALSSVPTVPWTSAILSKCLEYAEKEMCKRDFPTVHSGSQCLNMFWDGSIANLAGLLRTGWYKNLITCVTKFIYEHVTPDTVILSQVKKNFNSYHVLQHDEVYSEPEPYKSSWLNVNEQLDDIDKEFGFQWSLKHRLHVLESDSQPDQVGTGNSIPAQTESEASIRVSSPTELEPVDSSDEKQASSVSTQTVSPSKTECVDSSDPYYSFEIQVLPSDEAQLIFEQLKSKMPQRMDTNRLPEKVTRSSLEGELPDVIDVTLNDSRPKKKSVFPIEQVCCIDKWMNRIMGSSTPSFKCQCKNEPSHKPKDFPDKTLDNEDIAIQKKDKRCAIRSDSKLHSVVGEQNQAKSGENIDIFCQTIDLTQGDDNPHSYSDREPKSISQISITSSQSSITLISENKDLDCSISENEICSHMLDFEKDSQMIASGQLGGSDSSEKERKQFFRSGTEIQSDPEVDCVGDQLKSTESTLSCTSVSRDKEIENLSESEVANQMSALEENCGQAQLTSTNMPESSLETREQTQISATSAVQTTVERKQKRLSSYDGFVPFTKKSTICNPHVDSQSVLEGVSKCGKVFLDATDGVPSASNVRTVELILFGSTQDQCGLLGSRKRHISSSESGIPRPPEVITVKLSPLRRKSRETLPPGENSVKLKIHEKWRRSFPPTKIRHRKKLKTQMRSFASLSGVNHKKAEVVGPTNTEELPVSSEMRIHNRNAKRSLSLKRRRSFSNGLKHGGEKKKKKDAVSLKQRAHQERSNGGNGSLAVKPLQENEVLRFSVLPNTFNFKDGSNGRKETSDPVPDKPDVPEGKEKSHNKSVVRPKDTWCPKPEKKYRPLLSPPTSKNSSLFHVFQKKYMERTQQSMDE